MRKMKEFLFNAFTVVSNYFGNHIKERILLGVATVVSSVVSLFLLTTYCKDSLGLSAHFFLGFMFIIGMTMITNDTDRVEKILMKMSYEIMAFLAAAAALMGMLSGYNRYTHYQMNLGFIILTFVCGLVFIAYVLRFATWLFSKMKKIVNFVGNKIVSTDVEGATKKIGEILKNLVSIAGTCVAIYAFIEPIISKILGL